eukprot:scaffold160685_cov24-Tisochrysis_lutea.AAC.2
MAPMRWKTSSSVGASLAMKPSREGAAYRICMRDAGDSSESCGEVGCRRASGRARASLADSPRGASDIGRSCEERWIRGPSP